MNSLKLDTPEALKELATSSYTGVFELLHTGICIISAKGKFIYANSAYFKMFNLPDDLIGRDASDIFLTAEQGIMTAIRTRKTTICSSVTKDDIRGVSFRYPLLDSRNELIGVIVESIPTDIGKENLLSLLNTVRDLEEKAEYFERKAAKQPGMLYTFESIVGECEAMQTMKRRGQRFAQSVQ